jgi:hypothetical protein
VSLPAYNKIEELEAARKHLHCISSEQLSIALSFKEESLSETHDADETLWIGLEGHCLAV